MKNKKLKSVTYYFPDATIYRVVAAYKSYEPMDDWDIWIDKQGNRESIHVSLCLRVEYEYE